MTCPKGSIAGGLDAILGDPTLDVRLLGTLGSPVNPGITTSRSVVFVAIYARGAADRVPARARLHPDERRRRPLDDRLPPGS